jgi:hypothetical protein
MNFSTFLMRGRILGNNMRPASASRRRLVVSKQKSS